jgi:outer membrane protein OmpA-like peptidoglycan-associated protein
MNKLFQILLSLISYSLLFLTACSTPKPVEIKSVYFPGFCEINKGDTAKITWQIDNAEKVRIENLKRNYLSKDSIRVSPDTTTNYKFLAYNDKDTLKLNWLVVVKQKEDGIKTGPEARFTNSRQPSYTESKYFNGMISSSVSFAVNQLKILSHSTKPAENDSIYLKVLPLDEFGNFIVGLGNRGAAIDLWSSNITCNELNQNNQTKKFYEHTLDSSKPVDIAVCLDNSSIAGDYYPIFDQIKEFSKFDYINDRIHFRSFNQNLLSSISLQPADKFYDFIKDVRLEKASGLSSIYKHLYSSLSYLNSFKNDNSQILILIAFSSDNSSIVYDRNDVVELAVKFNIPIYIIAVGNAVDSYSLRYLAEFTGAKYYEVEDSEINQISNILNEITFVQKAHYDLALYQPTEYTKMCNNAKLFVNLNIADKIVADSANLRFYKERQFFKYQSVASFEYRDTVPDPQFYETIKSLAMILQTNTDKSVELIGNSSIEGTNEESLTLGLRRAQSVRRYLIENGANPAQIRVRTDGANNPVYYMQESTWMQYYNRRVEIRWLDQNLLPFEIIAQIDESETDALKHVESWEDKGYRAYYERYLQNNIPIYRVKIWGFKTNEEAEKTAANLTKKYDVKLTVQ